MIKLENKTWSVMTETTQKSWGALFPSWSLQKTKMKTKTNWMGILISKKAFSIIKVFVVTTININNSTEWNKESLHCKWRKKITKLIHLDTVKKCVSFFYFEKCANFRKMSIYEGYFIQLKPKFSMWSV